MHIVCPHCTTSYAIDPATLGAAGRTVRCSRCKEVWLARPEDAIEIAAGTRDGGSRRTGRRRTPPRNGTRMAPRKATPGPGNPVVDSPSISADWPADESARQTDWPTVAPDDDGFDSRGGASAAAVAARGTS